MTLLLFKQVKLFENLSENELNLLLDKSIEVKFRKGETIFKQGTQVTHVVFLTSGIGKVYAETNGADIIFGIACPIDIVGLITTFHNNIYINSFTAISPVTVCLIEIDIFRKVLESNSKFLLSCANYLSLVGVLIINRVVTLVHKQTNGRVADSLLYLSKTVYNSNPFPSELSRQELADLCAISKEATIRVLRQFKDSNIILENKKTIEILDFEKLSKISAKG